MGKHASRCDVEAAPSLYNEQSYLSREGLDRWEGFPIAYARADGIYHNPGHYADYPSLACIASGTATARIECNGRSFAFSTEAGSIGLFAPHTDIQRCEWNSVEAERIIIALDMSDLNPRMAIDDDCLAAPLALDLKFHDAALLQTMVAIAQEVRAGCPNGQLFAQSLCLGLALYMRRTHSCRSLTRAFDRGRLTPRQLQSINDYIMDSLDQNISVETMARLAGLSKAHFMKMFKLTTNTSPHQYVMRARLERAVVLMQKGLELADVAQETGFSSQSHFTSVFARAHGMPPKKYMSSVLQLTKAQHALEPSE